MVLQKVLWAVGDMGDEGKVPYAIRVSSWILFNQELDSLDVEGNLDTKQDAL